MGGDIKIVSLNVNGLRDNIKRKRLITLLRNLKSEVVLLQETHVKQNNNVILRDKAFPYQWHSNGSSKSRGTAILLHRTVQFQEDAVLRDKEGRYVAVRGTLNGEKVTIASIYAPNVSQISFLDNTFHELASFGEGVWLLAGDYNYIPDLKLDRSYDPSDAALFKENSYTAFHKLLDTYALVDSWRHHHPLAKDYTFYSARHKVHTRIDMILVSKGSADTILDADIGVKTISDHSWISCDIRLGEPEVHDRRWTLNKSLLQLDSIKEAMVRDIQLFFLENATEDYSDIMVWDAMKATMRGSLIAKASQLKKTRQHKIHSMVQNIKRLETIHKETGNAGIYQQLLNEREALRSIETAHIQKNLLYLKQHAWHNSPRALKLLAWRVRKQKAQRTILSIQSKQGHSLHKMKDIMQEFETFYSSLYKSHKPADTDIQSFLKNHSAMRQLTAQHKTMLDDDISSEEILRAIKEMKSNKMPGPDGFPVEFFKTFGDILAPEMEKTFNSIIHRGALPPSWYEAELVPILKQDKDSQQCSSYRPIALLNVDAKIFTSVLARRLQTIIAQYIHTDQTGFIPHRNMMDNIRKTLNIIRLCKSRKTPSLILSLDFKKAFDSVEYNYILQLLQHMNFGEHFMTAMKAIYNKPKARIKVNAARSRYINIDRGTRQGCPLSPLLFALCIEPLANMIRNHPEITGIKHAHEEFKTSLFADDVILYLTSPKQSLPVLETVISEFRKASGLSLNETKSEIYPIFLSQEDRTDLHRLTSYRWITSAWRYLGVMIPVNITNIYKVNFTDSLRTLTQSLTSLSRQTFSWMDRIHVVKSFMLPKFLFLTRMLPIPIPKPDLQKWQGLLNKFIWDYKRHRISHKIMRLPRNRGSIGIPDIQLYYEAAQLANVLRILNMTSNTDWMRIEFDNGTNQTPQEILWSPSCNRPKTLRFNSYCMLTLKIWDKWKPKLTGQLSPLLPLTAFLGFPEDIRRVIATWNSDAVYTLRDTTNRGEILPKADLERKTGRHLPWMHYFQLRSALSTPEVKRNLKRQTTSFEKLLVAKDPSMKNKLSILYHILLDYMPPAMDAHRKQWERECGRSLDSNLWDAIYQKSVLSTNISSLRLQAIKLLNHWYVTPSWLHKIKRLSTPRCWKGCGQPADTAHCWWQCPFIAPFWQEIHKIIKKMTLCSFDLTPSQMVLHDWPPDSIPPHKERIVSTLLALAKTEIAAKWKSKVSPTVQDWYERLWECFLLSKITDKILCSTNPIYHSSLERDWSSILTYLAEKNIVSNRFLDKSFLSL